MATCSSLRKRITTHRTPHPQGHLTMALCSVSSLKTSINLGSPYRFEGCGGRKTLVRYPGTTMSLQRMRLCRHCTERSGELGQMAEWLGRAQPELRAER